MLKQAKLLLTTIITLVIISYSASAWSEQKQDFGDYEVHYIALPTTILSPDIAKSYSLQRSKSTGFLNISVLKKQPDGPAKPVAAFVRGSVRNDVQQQRTLEFSRVSEGDAIYQIAQFWYSQGDPLTFLLEVQADPNAGAFKLRFTQSLYPD